MKIIAIIAGLVAVICLVKAFLMNKTASQDDGSLFGMMVLLIVGGLAALGAAIALVDITILAR